MSPMNPRLLVPRAAGGFDPRRIANLAGWWAADISTLFQSSAGVTAVTATDHPIGYWSDLSGNGRHLLGTDNTTRPFFKPSSLNGLNTIFFDGVNDTIAATFTLPQPTTVFCVAQFRTNTLSQATMFDGGSGNTMRLYQPSSSAYQIFAGVSLSTPSLTVTGWHVFEAVFNTTSSSLTRNGTVLVSGNVGTATPGGFRLGTFGNGFSAPGDIDVAEAAIYSRVLSAAEASRVRQYLGNKYGLAVV